MYYMIFSLATVIAQVDDGFLPLSSPYTTKSKTDSYNYGYWFKYQPLNQLGITGRFSFITTTTKTIPNKYMISAEVSSENTLTLCHYSLDNYDHVIEILKSSGTDTYKYTFSFDKYMYEGYWNFFGIQKYKIDEYQIFFVRQLPYTEYDIKTFQIKDALVRQTQQQYYLGWFGMVKDFKGFPVYFKQFKGKLSKFIDLPDGVADASFNFDNAVIKNSPSIFFFSDGTSKKYFDTLFLDGLSFQKFSYTPYREGIRYGISMWVKSSLEQYPVPINYTLLRATINEYYQDSYMGDKQLYIQYQTSLSDIDNNIFLSSYTYDTPVYSVLKQDSVITVKLLNDLGLQTSLKKWHFMQFEQGRVYDLTQTPPQYNTLFLFNLPGKDSVKNDFGRLNFHFSGVPMYFYLGGGLQSSEYKFVGSISQLTFITSNFQDLSFSVLCHGSCKTCTGPTPLDCLTCEETLFNRELSLNQCVCKQGYVLDIFNTLLPFTCVLRSSFYPTMSIIQTQYPNCDDGYDQCKEKIICSYGYFKYNNLCFQCPQQPSLADQIFCTECMFNSNQWNQICETNLLRSSQLVFQSYKTQRVTYQTNLVDTKLQLQIITASSSICQDGYGYDTINKLCIQCQNCLQCSFKNYKQVCQTCPNQFYLENDKCIQCGFNCQSCDQNGCLVCQTNNFLTLDRQNCQTCTISNCLYCHQYYQDGSLLTISLDLDFSKIDLTLDKVKIGCARCKDQYYIKSDQCSPFTAITDATKYANCQTGIEKDDGSFQCLIGTDKTKAIQYSLCTEISNCKSCFVAYPTKPWCVECIDGYYVQLEDGICVPCSGNCGDCVKQNSLTKDSWKANIRAFYYQKYSTHTYENFALDFSSYSYNQICTSCKQGYILYGETCIQSCGSYCDTCEVINSKATCTKCMQNQSGQLQSVDGNQQCLECPQMCTACIQRTTTEYQAINDQFEPTSLSKYENRCYQWDSTYFLDNELGMPVECEIGKKCFKSMLFTMSIYCADRTPKIDTSRYKSCLFADIQLCLTSLFGSIFVDYTKYQVIKEFTLKLIIQDPTCVINSNILIFQTLQRQILSIQKSTLILQPLDGTLQLTINGNLTLQNFNNYYISSLIIQQTQNSQLTIYGQNINLNQIQIKRNDQKVMIQYVIFIYNLLKLEIQNMILDQIQTQTNYFIEVVNTTKSNVIFKLQDIQIISSNFTKYGFINYNIATESYFLYLNILNLQVRLSSFKSLNSLILASQQAKLIPNLTNLVLENNTFFQTQVLQFKQVIDPIINIISFKFNSFNQTEVIIMPVINLQSCSFTQNTINQSRLIQNNGTLTNQNNIISFKQLTIQQNSFTIGSQFIVIIQNDQSNLTVSFTDLNQIKNYQMISNNQQTTLSYEISLIYINANYVYLNNFNINRASGGVDLSIISTLEIIIKNYNIFTDGLFQTITKDKACLTVGSYNFSMYVFDLKYFELNTFTINYILSTDYPIIIIQSQSGLKKQQNEQIKILNGRITNNTLLIKELNRQSSIIQIKSEQVQQVYIENVNFTQNILNEYVQDQDKQSSTTLLIQSIQGQVNIQTSYFQNNYVMNSTNSPLFIQAIRMKLSDIQFTNNNVFDFNIIKTFLQLKYLTSVSLEQIYVQDFPIQSNGGSGQFIAQTISITNIIVSGSYAQNGGSFYIQTQGQSLVNITDSSFILSKTSEFLNSNGGVLYLDGSQSNLKFDLKNIQVKYAKSRKSGGFLYVSPSNLTLNIANLECINCFSMNGGTLIIASTDDQIIPKVLLQNLSLQNPDTRWFLQTLTSLTSDDILILQRQSFLIYLQNTILEIQQLIVTNGNLFGILYFDGNNGLIINNTNIEGYSPYQIPLITISHSSTSQKNIKLANIIIENIVQEQMSTYDCNSSRIVKLNSQYQCKLPDTLTLQTFSYQSSDYLINNYQCNTESIYQKINEYVVAVQIYNFTTNYLSINNISIINVSYNILDYGLLCIRDFSSISNQIKLRNLRLMNNSCLEKGCLLIASSMNDLLSQPGRLLQSQIQQVESTSKATVKIYDSYFISNQAKYGSGIYIYNTQALVMNSFFQHNVAEMLGGAIYFNSLIYNLELLNTQILNNTAKNQSGSGIYILNQPMPYLKGLNNIIYDNGQDFNEIPQTFQMKLNGILLNKYFTTNDSEQLIEEVEVSPYKILGQSKLTDTIMLPSGQSIKDYQYFDENSSLYIPYNITLRFIVLNSQQQQLLDQNVVINISARTNNDAFNRSYFKTHQFAYDNETQSINLDNLIIYFSPYEANPLEIKVESQDVYIPIYSTDPPYNLISSKAYQFKFFIKTFQCQLGQFFNSTSQSCEQCSGSTYSVKRKSKVCIFKDDDKIESVQSAILQLKPGYWRAYVQSEQIDECFHLTDNCVGGWGVGNDLCYLGHIGALCEQCDLYNIRGSGAYSVSVKYQCGACSGAAYNAITIVLIILWTFISIIMSVDSTIEIVKDHIQKSKFIQIGLIFSDAKPNPAILIKVLGNYIQIITTITTFQLKVPPGIQTVFQSTGNPINQMSYSLDCFLINFSDINIIYFRIIWEIVLAGLYISIYLLGYMLLVILHKVQYNVAAVTTCFIYLFIYLQPNLVGSLISLASFRIISSEYWISGNVSYRFSTSSHTVWLLAFVLPTLIIIGIVVPIALWYGIYKNRNNLNDTNFKQIWGYLYNEYRLGAYYWETIKIFLREFIIIVLAFYEDQIPIKAALVFVSLFFYSFITHNKKPYNLGLYNKLDQQQTTVCAVSIILAPTIYTAQQYQLSEIIWPFYFIIGILNVLFIVKLLIILIYAYTYNFQTQLDGVRDKIVDKFPFLITNYRFLRPILENSQQRKKRIKDRYQQVRQYLIPQAKKIIQFKKDNKIIISQKDIEIKIPDKKQYIRYNQVNQESPVLINDQEDAQMNITPLNNKIVIDNEIDHVPEDVESQKRIKNIQQQQGAQAQNQQDNSQDNENTINFKSSQNQG